jgi:hypothetical protein
MPRSRLSSLGETPHRSRRAPVLHARLRPRLVAGLVVASALASAACDIGRLNDHARGCSFSSELVHEDSHPLLSRHPLQTDGGSARDASGLLTRCSGTSAPLTMAGWIESVSEPLRVCAEASFSAAQDLSHDLVAPGSYRRCPQPMRTSDCRPPYANSSRAARLPIAQ